MATPTPDQICSRCEKPLDTTGKPQWCKACRAKYQREYTALKKEMVESRGFAAGQSSMRHFLAEQFAKFGYSGSFSGAEIAHIIRHAVYAEQEPKTPEPETVQT